MTKENAEINRIKNVNIYESDRLNAVNEQKFAVILTNPPIRAGKKVVHEIYEQSYERLLTKGEIMGCDPEETRCAFSIEKLRTV